jgi:hypothetical protein
MRADDLRNEVNAQMVEWEQAEPRSRPEHEAAEAFTRAWAELDALMRDGGPGPVKWEISRPMLPATFAVVQTDDLEMVVDWVRRRGLRGEDVDRLRAAYEEAKTRAPGASVIVTVADLKMLIKNILAIKNKPGVAEAMERLVNAYDAAEEAEAK